MLKRKILIYQLVKNLSMLISLINLKIYIIQMSIPVFENISGTVNLFSKIVIKIYCGKGEVLRAFTNYFLKVFRLIEVNKFIFKKTFI